MKKSSQRESQTTGDAYTTILYKMETIRVFFSFCFWKNKTLSLFSSFFIQKKGRVVTAIGTKLQRFFPFIGFSIGMTCNGRFWRRPRTCNVFHWKKFFGQLCAGNFFFQSPLSRNGTCGGDWLENKKEKNIKIGVTCGFMCAWMCVGVYSECKCDLACKCEFHVFMFKYKCVLVSVLYCVRVNVSCGCVSYCTDVCASVCGGGGGWWMNEWKEMEGDQK